MGTCWNKQNLKETIYTTFNFPKLWFKKINDKVKKGGYFIHFGPLDYFFSDESEMLTAIEFKDFFEKNGYTTITDQILETSHLNDSNSFSYKVYRNWLFIAKKK